MKQRRRTPRCLFPAAAQVILDGAVESAKVVDLSLNECRLVTSPVASRGTVMKVKIMADGQYFGATGKVAHFSPDGGTGIVFQAVQPVFLFILQKWLRSASVN
jgi:PilZ domain